MRYICFYAVLLTVTMTLNTATAQDPFDQDEIEVTLPAEHRWVLGVGGVVGQPTGGTAKYWLNWRNAFEIAAGWSLVDDNSNVIIHLSYLLHNYNDIQVVRGELPYYFGIGPHFRVGDNPVIGVRIPVGLTYLFERDPLELFIEAAPALELSPSTVLHIHYGLGLRYYPAQLRN